MIPVPERLRSKAANVSGGGEWLSELPDVIRRLSEEWSIDLGSPFDDCHISLVVAADRAGLPLVLKIPMPSTIELGTLPAGARAREADALKVWAGNGAVQLVDLDAVTGAMLAERCLPGATLADLDPCAADDVAIELLSRLHVSPSPGTFERLSDRAARLSLDLPVRVDEAKIPIDHELVDTAIGLLGQLSAPGPAEILLHGDFHHANILSARREAWLAIDPLPMIGDPAYDCVQYLLFRMGDLADPSADWARVMEQFCRRMDADPERVKAWLFARLVSDAVAACTQGTTVAELEAPLGDLWAARLVNRLRS